ncbi:MAG: hypothetical protein KA151_08585 [Piscinibacter sp.]|nr:hypothetical protein [Piscinibacter sp.]
MIRQAHTTKRGPGRRHKDGTDRGSKRGRPGGVGRYGAGLRAQFARNRLNAILEKAAKKNAG